MGTSERSEPASERSEPASERLEPASQRLELHNVELNIAFVPRRGYIGNMDESEGT